MPEPEGPGGRLLEAITGLNANVERLVQLLGSRQQEFTALGRAVDRAVTQSESFSGAIRALVEKSDRTAAELESLASEHTRLTVWLTQVEQRIEDRDLPRGVQQATLEALDERITRLERGGYGPQVEGAASGAPEAQGGGGRLPPQHGASAPIEPEPADLTARVERLERGQQGLSRLEHDRGMPIDRVVERLDWKEQTLSRIVQRLVEILLGGQGGAPEPG